MRQDSQGSLPAHSEEVIAFLSYVSMSKIQLNTFSQLGGNQSLRYLNLLFDFSQSMLRLLAKFLLITSPKRNVRVVTRLLLTGSLKAASLVTHYSHLCAHMLLPQRSCNIKKTHLIREA